MLSPPSHLWGFKHKRRLINERSNQCKQLQYTLEHFHAKEAIRRIKGLGKKIPRLFFLCFGKTQPDMLKRSVRCYFSFFLLKNSYRFPGRDYEPFRVFLIKRRKRWKIWCRVFFPPSPRTKPGEATENFRIGKSYYVSGDLFGLIPGKSFNVVNRLWPPVFIYFHFLLAGSKKKSKVFHGKIIYDKKRFCKTMRRSRKLCGKQQGEGKGFDRYVIDRQEGLKCLTICITLGETLLRQWILKIFPGRDSCLPSEAQRT